MQPSLNENKPIRPIVYDDEIDLAVLWQALWNGKKLIAICTILAAIFGVVVALMLPNIYRSEALLAPVQSDQSGGIAALAGQLGGLASLAGINLDGSASDRSDLAIEILKSRQFLTAFIKAHDILIPVSAAKGWDDEKQEWIYDNDIYDVSTKNWVPSKFTRNGKGPSDWEAVEAFRDFLSVTKDKKNGFVTVAIDLFSPLAAKQWVDWLIADLHGHMKELDITEAAASIQYLEEQAGQTSVKEMQNVFYQLIEQQTQTMMLANVRSNYIFDVIDPAVVPEEKIKPKRALICLAITLLGAMLAVSWVLISHYRKQQ